MIIAADTAKPIKVNTLVGNICLMDHSEKGTNIEDELERLRNQKGEVIDEPKPYVKEATKDTIRHWAHAIGTNNPLYVDEEYAKDTKYNSIIAPPTFLYATSKVTVGFIQGLPGVHSMHGGGDWTWHQPIKCGYRIQTTSWLKDIEEIETTFGGRTFKQTYRIEFRNQHEEHLATLDRWSFRIDRDQARDNEKYEKSGVELAEWTGSDIDRFAKHYRNEEPRGHNTRYFEDVKIGESLDTLLKGPMSLTQVIMFEQGMGGGFIKAHRQLFELFDKNPALAIPNDRGVPEPPEKVHWDWNYAKRVGVPAPFDFGPERISWLGHVAHHWMGDDGFLKNMYVEVRQHNMFGDITWCSGEVIEKRTEGNEHLVDIELEGRNQRDEVTTKGNATINLPTR